TEPDLRTPADVRAFLGTLKRTLEYIDVSDCNMEEGSLRADANISVRRQGAERLGTKTEIKNVNSFSGIERALTIEIARQIEVLEAGGTIHQESLLWDDHRGELRSMRSKEESHDYRYFPEPDLPPLRVSAEEIEAARDALPELPRARRARLKAEYSLPEYDADILTQSLATADYFEEVVAAGADAKTSSNWVMGALQALMNERGDDARTVPVRPASLARLVGLARDGTVSDSAAKKVLVFMAEEGGEAIDIVEAKGLLQVRDPAQLAEWVESVVDDNSDEVARYRSGETKVLGFLVGQVKRRSKGKADPRRVNVQATASSLRASLWRDGERKERVGHLPQHCGLVGQVVR
ncbi:MAG: Asp-tRNA(Asn)/Glu-tRNA(Gln) amidotransferase subunit GatB, partial [Deltaproteobacteria bacterium]|nr:Asp-tRNA(Asn)/Glu-tRNA(Gln) amidotransferase subunit GatB [Deltaproteobacteria bacterium]